MLLANTNLQRILDRRCEVWYNGTSVGAWCPDPNEALNMEFIAIAIATIALFQAIWYVNEAIQTKKVYREWLAVQIHEETMRQIAAEIAANIVITQRVCNPTQEDALSLAPSPRSQLNAFEQMVADETAARGK